MVISNDVHLPEEHELNHPEIPLSSPALKAASFHMGKYCENQSNVSHLKPQTCSQVLKESLSICVLIAFQIIRQNTYII